MDSTIQMLAIETWQWLVITVSVIMIVVGLVLRSKKQA